jgi:hypothetical protein
MLPLGKTLPTIALLWVLNPTSAESTWINASTQFVNEGDWVEVTWQLGDDAALQLSSDLGEVCTEEEDGGALKRSCSTTVRGQGCWVGEFLPSGADIEAFIPPDYTKGDSEWAIPFTNPAPAKFVPCRLFSEGSWAEASADGSGSFNFSTTNRRTSFEYAIFDGGFLKPRLLARTGPISFTDNIPSATAVASSSSSDEPVGPPQHRRLARVIDDSKMRVSWTSAQGDLSGSSTGDDNHRVKWGFSPGDTSSGGEAAAETTSYSASELCGSPGIDVGFVDPGFFHSAVMGPFDSQGVRVYYVVGSDAFGWSEEASFLAADSERR